MIGVSMVKKNTLILLILFFTVLTPVFTAGRREKQDNDDEWLEYDFYYDTDVLQDWMNNPNDIVTPYVESKFKLKLRDVYWRSGMMTKERLATFIATDTLPHVFSGGLDAMLLAQDFATELQDLIPEYMPNYWNTSLEPWERNACMLENGKIFWLYKKDHHGMSEEALLDPYDNGIGLSPVIREDILAKLGFTFTPIKEIQITCREEKRAPTLEDWKIDPLPYRNAYEFADFLRRIKAGNFRDIHGNPVFPLTVRWGIQILATVFDWGSIWKYYPEDENCYAALGSKETKKFLEWWWSMYRDGLIDPQYVGQSPGQLQDKIASGRAAVTIYIADPKKTQDILLDHNPEWYLRPLPLPYNSTDPREHGYYYLPTPGSSHLFLNKDNSDALTKRLMSMWDWLNTDEGIGVLCYGPPDAGLTVERNGNLFFREPLMSQILQEKRFEPGGIEDLGLAGSSAYVNHEGNYWSKIGICSAAPKETRGIGIRYNLEPRPDVLSMGRRRFCAPSFAYGNAVANPSGEAPAAVWEYWNSTFKYNEISIILQAQTKDEFNKAFELIMERNDAVGRFREAQRYMMNRIFNKRDLSDISAHDYSIHHEWYW